MRQNKNLFPGTAAEKHPHSIAATSLHAGDASVGKILLLTGMGTNGSSEPLNVSVWYI